MCARDGGGNAGRATAVRAIAVRGAASISSLPDFVTAGTPVTKLARVSADRSRDESCLNLYWCVTRSPQAASRPRLTNHHRDPDHPPLSKRSGADAS